MREPTGPCYTFYLASSRTPRPVAFTLANGDVRFAILAPESFEVQSGGVAFILTGVRIKIPRGTDSSLEWQKPDWVPDHVHLVTTIEEGHGDITVRLYNASNLSFPVSRHAWILIGYVIRPDPWWVQWNQAIWRRVFPDRAN